MATYAIGDIQGCYQTLRRLLNRIAFDRAADRLWLVGDLVNRGPRSLEVLRWARDLEERITVVLGNHDLHLIGRMLDLRPPKKSDTLEAVVQAPDAHELVEWLRHRPLLHRQDPYVIIHAGLHPAWTVGEAEGLAREAEAALRSGDLPEAIASLRSDPTPPWSPELSGAQRLQAVLQALTRLRMLSGDGVCESFSGPPEEAPPGCIAWFDAPNRRSRGSTVITGHWAALGLRIRPGLMALDSGCVWGGTLTAARLEDGAIFQEKLAD